MNIITDATEFLNSDDLDNNSDILVSTQQFLQY